MLDQVSALVDSIPGDRISDLLDETFKAFNGAGPDFGSLLDSASKLTEQTSTVSPTRSRGLIDDSGPLLDSQAETPTRSGRGRAASTGSPNNSHRTIHRFDRLLRTGPGFAQEVSRCSNQIKPTLPVLLANLTTLGQILVTYNPSLEQLLVVFPGTLSAQQSFGLAEEQPDRPADQRFRADHL